MTSAAHGDRAVRTVEATTELRRILANGRRSARSKYADLVVGRPGVWALLKHELITCLFGPIPGALGLALRQRAYRLLLGRCGRGVAIGRNVTLRHPHRIELGDRVVIDDNCVLDGKGSSATAIRLEDDVIIGRSTILSCKHGTIRIGRRANISVNCTLISETSLTIGERVLVAGHCYIIAGGGHGAARLDVPVLDQPRIEKGGVVIEENCWLGAGVIVLDGVRMGRDTIAGAGAVVTRDVPEFCAVGGVPARILYDRREREATEEERSC